MLRNSTGTRVCDRTVRNRLHAAQLKACRARVHLGLTRRQWRNVLFSDESRFNVSFADGRVRTWRRRGERLVQDNVVERDRYGGGSVMIWAGIRHDGKKDFVTVPGNLTAQRYCDGIIESVVVPYLQKHNVGVFGHDNARPNTSRHTQNIFPSITSMCCSGLQDRRISLPLSTFGDCLGRQVRERHDVNNIRDLKRALQAEWVRIPLQVIRKLICSMRRRCLAGLHANGGHTRY